MPRLFENAFAHAAIGMALVGLDGRWLLVNPSICKLVGYAEAELLASTFQDITHPDDLDTDLAYVAQLLRGEIETYQMEKRYRHKDGRFVWALLSVSLAHSEIGAPLYFISQVQDITARKVAEQDRERLYEELRAATEEIRALQEGLVTICAWTKRVRNGTNWVPLEEFLSNQLHLRVSHGISDEIAAGLLSEQRQPGEH